MAPQLPQYLVNYTKEQTELDKLDVAVFGDGSLDYAEKLVALYAAGDTAFATLAARKAEKTAAAARAKADAVAAAKAAAAAAKAAEEEAKRKAEEEELARKKAEFEEFQRQQEEAAKNDPFAGMTAAERREAMMRAARQKQQ